MIKNFANLQNYFKQTKFRFQQTKFRFQQKITLKFPKTKSKFNGFTNAAIPMSCLIGLTLMHRPIKCKAGETTEEKRLKAITTALNIATAFNDQNISEELEECAYEAYDSILVAGCAFLAIAKDTIYLVKYCQKAYREDNYEALIRAYLASVTAAFTGCLFYQVGSVWGEAVFLFPGFGSLFGTSVGLAWASFILKQGMKVLEISN